MTFQIEEMVCFAQYSGFDAHAVGIMGVIVRIPWAHSATDTYGTTEEFYSNMDDLRAGLGY